MTDRTLREKIEALPRHKLVRHGPEYQDMMMVRPDGGWLSRAEVLRILDAHTAAQPAPTCRRCHGVMRLGIAMGQTVTAGTPDDVTPEASTLSAGGPGQVIDCWKCSGCGWSVTQPAPDAVAEAFVALATEIEAEEREAATWGGPDPRGPHEAKINLRFARMLRDRAKGTRP